MTDMPEHPMQLVGYSVSGYGDLSASPDRLVEEAVSIVAERLYRSYNVGGDPDTAWLNYKGERCPEWDDLPANVRAKWENVAWAISEAPAVVVPK